MRPIPLDFPSLSRFTLALLGVVLGAGGAECAAQPAAASATYAGKTVAEWQADLADLASQGSEDKRRRAAYALGQIGPAAKSAVPALIEVVNDPYMEPRWYAVDALGRIGGDAQVAEAIAAAIRKPENDVYVRRKAVRALGRLGSAAQGQIDLLVGQLAGEDSATRAGAALALWQVAQRPDAVDALKSMLTARPDDAPFQAAMSLLEMGAAARPALPELIAALGHDSADVRRAAAKVLGGLGIEAARGLQAELLRPDSRIDQAAAAAALAQIVDRVREQVLYRSEMGAAAFDQAVRALEEIALPPLLALMESPAAEVRREAGWALARLGPMAAAPLMRLLEHEDAAVRASAAEALLRMERYLPAESPAPPNVERLKQQLIGRLAEATRNPRFETRYAAVRLTAALSFGPEAGELAPLLTAALEDEDAGIRRYAAQALGGIQP